MVMIVSLISLKINLFCFFFSLYPNKLYIFVEQENCLISTADDDACTALDTPSEAQ